MSLRNKLLQDILDCCEVLGTNLDELKAFKNKKMNREIKFRAFYDNRMHDNTEALRILYNNSTEGSLTPKYLIMQYTGLKDKNGKEIYEGDVIAWSNGVMSGFSKISFYDGSFRMANYPFSEHNMLETGHRIQVIGNIFENPELLTNVTP